jgi:hypothetical protein
LSIRQLCLFYVRCYTYGNQCFVLFEGNVYKLSNCTLWQFYLNLYFCQTYSTLEIRLCNTLHKIDRVVLYSIDYCLLFSEQYFSFTDQDENKFINYKSYIEMKYICGWANWDKAFDSHWKKYEVYEKFSPVLVTTAMHLLFIQIYKRCLVFETVYRMFIFD